MPGSFSSAVDVRLVIKHQNEPRQDEHCPRRDRPEGDVGDGSEQQVEAQAREEQRGVNVTATTSMLLPKA